MIEVNELGLPGTFVIQAHVFRDNRGEFHKTIHRPSFEKFGLQWSFAEQFYTKSGKDVVRGMHYQRPPHDHVKLIYCTEGEAIDVLLDLRTFSPTYGKCVDVTLKGGDGQSIYIPKGVAHGFRSVVDNTTIVYAVTTAHEPSADQGVLWNSIEYDWQIKNPKLSARDQNLPSFGDLSSPFTKE